MNNLLKTYINLTSYANRNAKILVSVETSVFKNFYSCLFDVLSEKEYLDIDLIEYYLFNYIDQKKGTLLGTQQELDQFINDLNSFTKANMNDHIIVMPLFYSNASKIIKTKYLTIIPEKMNRDDKVKKLISISKINTKQGKYFATHTEKSRSPDFFAHPLICIRINHLTDIIKFRAQFIAKITFYTICGFERAFIDAEKPSISKFISSMVIPISKEKNSHIAIWTNKYVNFSHIPLKFEPILKTNIDWIETYKKEIDTFLTTMYDSLNRSELNTKFLNAFIVANKGLYLETINEHNLALITYLSAAESLLAENQNEKSLRLSTLLPRLAHVEDKNLKKYCVLVKSLYSIRNDFMHSANEYKGQSLEEKEDSNQLLVLSQLVFKLIVLNYDPTNTKSLNEFKKELGTLFEDILYYPIQKPKKV